MKTKLLAFLLSFLFLLTSGILKAQEEEEGDDNTTQEATDIPKYGNDSITCIMNISLYKESFKQWKASKYKSDYVKDAIKPWSYVLNNCPRSYKSLYLDGVKIMGWRIKKAADEESKQKMIDTLMMVYDSRIKYFGQEGFVLGRKGVDLYKYRPEAYEEIYKILERSIELSGDKTYPDVLVFFMRATRKMIEEGKASEEIIFDNYEKCSNIIEHNLDVNKDNEKQTSTWQNVKGNIEVTFEPYATCEALVKIYSKKYKETPDDAELLKKIIRSLDKKKCKDDPLYFEATVKLYDLEPSPESAFLIGRMLFQKEEYSKAIEYLKEGDKLEDEEDKADSYLILASAYKQLNNYPASRSYALKAATLMPDNGQPYIIIGDLYAETAKSCGDNDLTKKVAYWAAVDKYYRAKSVDPESAELANSRIATFSAYFPSAETIFFYNLNEGDDYTVECWINEKTKVRAAK